LYRWVHESLSGTLTDKIMGTNYLIKEVCYEKNSAFVFVLSDDRMSFLR
jgi:hypothetical protein